MGMAPAALRGGGGGGGRRVRRSSKGRDAGMQGGVLLASGRAGAEEKAPPPRRACCLDAVWQLLDRCLAPCARVRRPTCPGHCHATPTRPGGPTRLEKPWDGGG